MRSALIIILLLLSTACSAATVTLTWDLNDPAPDGYRVFVRPEGGSYNYDAVLWEGDLPPATVSVDDGATWVFVCRAYAGENESADSNEVSYDATVVVPPIDPLATQGFRIVSFTEVIVGPINATTSYTISTLPDGSLLFSPRGE